MTTAGVTFAATLDDDAGEVLLDARCPCGVSARRVASAAALHGPSPAGWRGPDARATQLRVIARALEDDGCMHAYHDARMVTPCLFRPTRSSRDEVAAAVAGIDDARGDEAWETLAARGLIPMAWVGDDARRFAGEGLDPWPTTALAALLATDAAGALRAEDLAREMLSRMERFGLAQPPRVAWRAVDPARWSPARPTHLSAALAHVGVAAPAFAKLPWWDLARLDVDGAEAWGRASTDLPNPFEPLAALWMAGYALDAVTDAAVVLAAPTA